MRWKTKQGEAAGKGTPVLHEVDLTADCVTKKDYPVHVKAVVIFRIGDPAVAKRARRDLGTQGDISTLVHDIFVRSLRSGLETFAWDEMLAHRVQVHEKICAFGEPEMSKLGLKIDSFAIRALDFPEDSVPLIALRAAQARYAARISAKAPESVVSTDAASEEQTADREAQE